MNWSENIQSRSVSAAVKIQVTYVTEVDNGAVGDGRGQFGDGRSSTVVLPSPAVAGAKPPKYEPRKKQNMLQPVTATRHTSRLTVR